MTSKPQITHARYNEWIHRAYFPRGGFLPLGVPGELSKGSVARDLLGDVLDAAGAVVFYADGVMKRLEDAEHVRVQHRRASPRSGEGNCPVSWVIDQGVAWDYATLLMWLRTVSERIDRVGPGRNGRSGLLPAIDDPKLKSDVRTHFDAFKRQVGGERRLAEAALHVTKLSHGSLTGVETDAGLRISIPDPPSKRIAASHELTFGRGRDLRSFAEDALRATESLIEGLLAAFEDANERVQADRLASAKGRRSPAARASPLTRYTRSSSIELWDGGR